MPRESIHALREGNGNGWGPAGANQISIVIKLSDSAGPATGPNVPGNVITATEAFEADLLATGDAKNRNDTGDAITAETDYDVFRSTGDTTPIVQLSPGIYTVVIQANATAAQERIWVRT
ncbi:MAG: hypothetical protein GY722_26170 [bacterium]|nr:hypothetical protein [bacterium]